MNIIIGMPGETKEDIEEAREFLKELYGTWFRIYCNGATRKVICIKKRLLRDI